MASSKALVWTTVGCVIGLGVAGYIGFRVMSRALLGDVDSISAELPKELELARSEGLPMKPEDLFPNRPLPESKNAAKVIVKNSDQILKALPSKNPVHKSITNLSKGDASPSDMKAIQDALAANRVPLDAIIAESRKPYCDFGKDYYQGFNVLFPEFAQIKTAAKLLCARAQISAMQRNLSDAEASLRASFQLAQYAGQEPCLIGALVKVALCAITHRSLRQIVYDHNRDPQTLAMADRVLQGPIQPVDFRLALESEFVVGFITIDMIKSLKDIEAMTGGSDPGVDLRPLFTLSDTMRKAWKTRHIQFWRRCFKRFPADPLDYRKMGDVLTEESIAEDRQKTLDYLMNRILTPVFDQTALACCKERSDLAMSRATIALFRERANSGSFPDRLDQTKGKFIDAFDGNPLRYRLRKVGFVLYSIGNDLKDDGGAKPVTGAGTGAPKDFVVEYP